MSLSERIKEVRKAESLTQTAFGKRLGIKQNSVALIESGKRNASDQTILAICREFGVNEGWLRTGEGEMKPPKADDEVGACLKKWGLPDEFRGLFLAYKELSTADQKSVRLFIRNFAKKILEQDETAPSVPESEAKNVHYWTHGEMREEFERQLADETADREKGTGESSTGSPNVSGAVTA